MTAVAGVDHDAADLESQLLGEGELSGVVGRGGGGEALTRFLLPAGLVLLVGEEAGCVLAREAGDGGDQPLPLLRGFAGSGRRRAVRATAAGVTRRKASASASSWSSCSAWSSPSSSSSSGLFLRVGRGERRTRGGVERSHPARLAADGRDHRSGVGIVGAGDHVRGRRTRGGRTIRLRGGQPALLGQLLGPRGTIGDRSVRVGSGRGARLHRSGRDDLSGRGGLGRRRGRGLGLRGGDRRCGLLGLGDGDLGGRLDRRSLRCAWAARRGPRPGLAVATGAHAALRPDRPGTGGPGRDPPSAGPPPDRRGARAASGRGAPPRRPRGDGRGGAPPAGGSARWHRRDPRGAGR